MRDHHCPNCGAAFGPQLASTRMMNCEFCGTSVVVEDDGLRLAGSQGVMHEAPSLIVLKGTMRLERHTWRVVGQARFSYGRGTWDEFWAVDERDEGAWISVDEGDVAIQRPLRDDVAPRLDGEPRLGRTLRHDGTTFTATEVETATCEAVRGSFPEELRVGEAYRFVNLSGEDGRLLSGEFWPGGQSWSLGAWVDPFDLRPVAP